MSQESENVGRKEIFPSFARNLVSPIPKDFVVLPSRESTEEIVRKAAELLAANVSDGSFHEYRNPHDHWVFVTLEDAINMVGEHIQTLKANAERMLFSGGIRDFSIAKHAGLGFGSVESITIVTANVVQIFGSGLEQYHHSDGWRTVQRHGESVNPARFLVRQRRI